MRFTRIVRAILGDVEGLIAPESVSEADTATILAFLNGATTAQQLADGIELPNEPDVGLRLGAHLLERRAALGTFTSLAELLTVPLIGPVRFTRIVRAILGKSTVPRDEFDALAAQVAALQAALARGRTAGRARAGRAAALPRPAPDDPGDGDGAGRRARRRRARDAVRELGHGSAAPTASPSSPAAA